MRNLNDIGFRSRDGLANMVNILAKQRNGAKICHINAQSLKNKIDEFRYIFENSQIDFICISETWFDDSISDLSISLAGYNICRNDRNGYGGVAIYIKKGIKFKIISKSGDPGMDEVIDEENQVEYIFLEVSSDERKLLLSCVYRPNRNVRLGHLFKKVEMLTVLYDDVVIAGDFNSNILVERNLSDVMTSLGLSSPNTSVPTHFTNTNNTLLDLFYVNNLSKILIYDQLSAPCFSKHDLIFVTYNFHLYVVPDQYITFRDFRNINLHFLELEFHKIDWSCLFYMYTVDEQLSFFEYNVNTLFNLTVPLKTKTICRKKKPWFTNKIKNAIHIRDLAYSRWKRFKTTQLHEQYRILRNSVNKLIRKAKSDLYAEKFTNALDGRKKWQIIREIGIGKIKQELQQDNADEINEQFLNIPMINADLNYYRNHSDIFRNHFSFACVNQCDVLSSCLSITSNAVGADGIHPKFLKIILPKLLPHLTFIFNKILTTSSYPTCWKTAEIIPIPKSNSEYRPIAILPFLSKVLEKLIHIQIVDFIDNNNLLTDKQSGFRKKNSCITALVDVAEDIRKDVDGGHVTFLVLLDHSKAFDTVDHNVLCYKLRNMFGFSTTATNLIHSYLSNRTQYVKALNTNSKPLPVRRGVPQGSILGPLLFSLYSNDLQTKLKECKIRMYADDIQLYISCKVTSFELCVKTLNKELKDIYLWATANGLSINPKKSKCIIIGKNLKTNYLTSNINITVNNQAIEIVNNAKNLGIMFNNTLTWSDHINYVCGRTFSMLRSLWHTQHCTPLNIRIMLAKTYLTPILLYGCELFASSDSRSTRKLNITFNNIVRYVYGLKRYDHISAFSHKVYGISFDNLLKTRVLIFLHKIIYTRQPNHLYERLLFCRSNRGKRLIIFKSRSRISKWQFFTYAIPLWNSLPHSSQTISNVFKFKRNIIKLFSN